MLPRHVSETIWFTDPWGMATFEVIGVERAKKGWELTFDDEMGELTLGVFADEAELEKTYGEMVKATHGVVYKGLPPWGEGPPGEGPGVEEGEVEEPRGPPWTSRGGADDRGEDLP